MRRIAPYLAIVNLLVLAVGGGLQWKVVHEQRALIALQLQTIEQWRDRALRCEAGGSDLVNYYGPKTILTSARWLPAQELAMECPYSVYWTRRSTNEGQDWSKGRPSSWR